MTNFESDAKFDIIILPDVLEHIPIEAHENIFSTISKLLKPTGKLIINIPNPEALEYLHIHHKELLQIIDQPIYSNLLFNNLYKHGFYALNMKTYSVFYNEPDYQFFSFKLANSLENITSKNKFKVVWEHIKLKLFLLIN